MPLQKAWDIYEATILLEALILVKEGKISRKDAIENVSRKLRDKARNEGFVIDDMFRNVAGITFQIHSMESAYVGYTVFKPATKLFIKIVELLQENKDAFDKLLGEAHEMVETKKSLEEQFVTWLSGKVSSVQLSELYMTFSPIEKFCIDRKIIKQSLFEIDDLQQLAKVRDTINQNHIFKFMHKRQISKMSAAIKYYIDFIKELEDKKNQNKEVPETNITEITIREGDAENYQVHVNPEERKNDFIEWMINQGMAERTATTYASSCGLCGKVAINHGIASVDIWEITDVNVLKNVFDSLLENREFLEKNESRHNQFRASLVKYIQFSGDVDFSSHRETRSLTENDSVIRRRRTTESNPQRDNFVDWMLQEGMAERTASSYASNLGTVGDLAKSYEFCDSEIWMITDANLLKEVLEKLLQNQEFVDKNETRHNQFRASFVKYIQFCGDEDFRTKRTSAKKERTNEEHTEEDELIKQTYPELYMRLKSMSKVYDDPTGVTVEWIHSIIGLQIEKELLEDILEQISWIVKVGEETYSFSKYAKPFEKQIEFDRDSFVLVLMQRYRNGMRFDSIDLENFRDSYFDYTDEELDLNDKDLEFCLRKCGVVYQGRLFPAEGIMDGVTREKLLDYIRENFEQGKKVLYYKSIFSDLADVFAYCFNLTDALMLKPYLEFVFESEEYFFSEEYVSREKNVKIDHTSEIEEFLISEGKPLSYDEIYAGLSHIAKDVIFGEIKSNPKIILNEKEHYYHYDIFEFSSEDADYITKYIQDEIDEEGYCIWAHVYSRIQREMPIFIENNSYLSTIGIRNAVAKKLSGRFRFEGEVIGSHQGASINMSTVYKLFGEHHAPFSDDDVYNFAREVSGGTTTPAYLDALAESTVRVSKELYVPKGDVEFDVAEIDTALSTYLSTGYMLIKDVDSFLVFPNVGYEWNTFLLESYLMYYSKEYALCNNGKSLNNVAGALVRRRSGFDEFEDVCADVLANGYVELTKNKALDYLGELNLLTRKSYAGIDKAIAKAKQIRNRKG